MDPYVEPYVSQKDTEQFNALLKRLKGDSVFCWERTRFHDASASLVCDGNVSIELVKLFDEIAKIVREHGNKQAS